MKLMTEELRRSFPPLYATEEQPIAQKIAYTCFFTPDSGWYWYPVEFDGSDLFFGLVAGQYLELGYFSLSELESVRGAWGLPIERDMYWHPTNLGEIIERHKDRSGAELLLPKDK